MDVTISGLIKNLRDWEWERLSSYSLKEPEAAAIIEFADRSIPRVAKEINRGEYLHSECPTCGSKLGTYDPYCRDCGQKIAWKERKVQSEEE